MGSQDSQRFSREASNVWTRRATMRAGLGGFCLCCLPTFGRAGDLTLGEVAPGIFIRRGVDEDATDGNLDAIANIGFIVGRDAVLVTDSGGSLADGQWLRAEIKRRTDKPIRYVVLSHVHPDHVFGAGAFEADKPIFIGHSKLPEALQQRGAFYQKGLAAIVGADKAGPIVMPTKLVRDHDTIDLGERTISLTSHGPAHTSCDLSMVDTKTGTLLPADLLFVKRVPSLDGSLLGWLRELDALDALQATNAVPGHGPAIVAYAGASQALRTYLVALRDGVRREIKSNGSIESAVKSVAQSEAPKWTLFADYNGRNVTQAYQELEWE